MDESEADGAKRKRCAGDDRDCRDAGKMNAKAKRWAEQETR
jgi:hypothetical protein